MANVCGNLTVTNENMGMYKRIISYSVINCMWLVYTFEEDLQKEKVLEV
jgi:hypothetical protein